MHHNARAYSLPVTMSASVEVGPYPPATATSSFGRRKQSPSRVAESKAYSLASALSQLERVISDGDGDGDGDPCVGTRCRMRDGERTRESQLHC
jgi:hypothetical protein